MVRPRFRVKPERVRARPRADTVADGATAGRPRRVSSNRRAANATTWSTAVFAWLPVAVTSSRCPASAPRTATRLRLDAGTGSELVVTFRSHTRASKVRTSATSLAAGRACSPCSLATTNTALAAGSSVATGTGVPSSGTARCACLPASAAVASVTTSSIEAPAAAATVAATSPSTSGAEHSRTRPATVGSSRSSAISADRTALPRSINTSTPSGSSTSSMASLTLTASVPKVASSKPAATATRTARPCSMSAANATAARASARLCETTTIPDHDLSQRLVSRS